MSGELRPSRGMRLGAAALVLAAGVVLLGWLAVALVHLDDRERVAHVQGAWMALSRYTNDGVFYPPLFDGERYGGTRWMPLGILLHAGAARLLGGELLGGKALTLVLAVALLAVVAAALRRQGASRVVTAALLAAVVSTQAGLFVTTTVGGDVLPVLLQMAALLAATKGGRRGLVVAGVLAGLAPLAKLTAGWAALAIVCWLATRRRWGDVGLVIAAGASTAVLGLAAALLLSNGRFYDTMVTFAFAGGTGARALVRAPHQVVFNLGEFAPGFFALLPVAVGAVLLGRRWRQASLVDLALGWALLTLLVAYTDIGTGLNQLLDLLVLTTLVAAQLPRRVAVAVGEQGTRPAVVAVGLATACALAAGVSLTLVPAVRTAVETTQRGHPLPLVPLAEEIDDVSRVLSEDPYVAVARGEPPVVLDAFMLRRLGEIDPASVAPLVAAVERQEFDYVLLVMPLEDDFWWQHYHFGLPVVEAIREGYRYVGERDGYDVYRPR